MLRYINAWFVCVSMKLSIAMYIRNLLKEYELNGPFDLDYMGAVTRLASLHSGNFNNLLKIVEKSEELGDMVTESGELLIRGNVFKIRKRQDILDHKVRVKYVLSNFIRDYINRVRGNEEENAEEGLA